MNLDWHSRTNRRAQLDRRSLAPERKPGADGQRAQRELADDRRQRQLLALPEQICRLDLRDAAAAGERHDAIEQNADYGADADQEWKQPQNAMRKRLSCNRRDKPIAQEVDGFMETDRRNAAQDADDDREREQDVRVAPSGHSSL